MRSVLLAAVVVAPGGGLRLLGWDNEGVKAARWLNSKGNANPEADDPAPREALQMGTADAQQALRLAILFLYSR